MLGKMKSLHTLHFQGRKKGIVPKASKKKIGDPRKKCDVWEKKFFCLCVCVFVCMCLFPFQCLCVSMIFRIFFRFGMWIFLCFFFNSVFLSCFYIYLPHVVMLISLLCCYVHFSLMLLCSSLFLMFLCSFLSHVFMFISVSCFFMLYFPILFLIFISFIFVF